MSSVSKVFATIMSPIPLDATILTVERSPMTKSILHRRVAKLEQAHAERMWQERLKDCNCPFPRNPNSTEACIVTFGREHYEAAMKVTCPVHGPRRPEDVLGVEFVAPD